MSFHILRKSTHTVAVPFLLAVLALTGCGASNSTGTPTHNPGETPPLGNGAENWQFETGSSITTSTSEQFFLAGALQINGSDVSGSFKTNGVCLLPNAIEQYTGTYNAATGTLTLDTGVVDAKFILSSPPTELSTGTMGGGGQICNLLAGGIPAVGIEIPPLTGTFTGPLTGSADAAATLTLAQSADPNAQAAFPLTGSLQLTSGTCSSTIPVSGSIQGVGFNLAATGTSSSGLTLTGVDASGGSSLTGIQLAFTSDPCNPGSASSYTGSLSQ